MGMFTLLMVVMGWWYYACLHQRELNEGSVPYFVGREFDSSTCLTTTKQIQFTFIHIQILCALHVLCPLALVVFNLYFSICESASPQTPGREMKVKRREPLPSTVYAPGTLHTLTYVIKETQLPNKLTLVQSEWVMLVISIQWLNGIQLLPSECNPRTSEISRLISYHAADPTLPPLYWLAMCQVLSRCFRIWHVTASCP